MNRITLAHIRVTCVLCGHSFEVFSHKDTFVTAPFQCPKCHFWHNKEASNNQRRKGVLSEEFKEWACKRGEEEAD